MLAPRLLEQNDTTETAASRLAQLRRDLQRDWFLAIGRWRGTVALTRTGAAGDAARQALARRLEGKLQDLITTGWTDSYRLGHALRRREAPRIMPDHILTRIASQREFAAGFARDIATGVVTQPFKMNVGLRSELYFNSVGGAFGWGAVDAGDPGEVIHWRLGATDHCPDCPVIAMGSPYSRGGGGGLPALPSTPRDGATTCRMRCACHLEFAPAVAAAPPEEEKPPFVDTALLPPTPPPGLRIPTTLERRQLRDLELRMNFARRKISETAGTNAQRGWVDVRRTAARRRREFMETRGVWDTPRFDVREVVSGKTVSGQDISELVRSRGIDGRTARRLQVDRMRDVVDRQVSEMADTLNSMPPTATGVPDLDQLLVRAGAPPELFPESLQEAAGDDVPAATTRTVNGVGLGGRSALHAHVAALRVLAADDYDVEVGPFDEGWEELVLAVGTWISGPQVEVERFVEAWLRAVRPAPAIALWTP